MYRPPPAHLPPTSTRTDFAKIERL